MNKLPALVRRLWPALPGLVAVGLALGVALGLTSCYPGEITNVDELSVVVTIRDPNADFGPLMTYSRRDSIRAIDDTGAEPEEVDVDSALTAAIMATIDSNMCRLGYTLVPLDQLPPDTSKHVIIEVGAIKSNTYILFSYFPYWPGYPGYPWWGCCWGGWWPPSTGSVTVPNGTVLIDMLYPEGADPSDPDKIIPVYWEGILNGVLQDNDITEQNLIAGVNQAYSQSTYLATTAGSVCP